MSDALHLHPDRPLRLDPARHSELRVVAGIVWITASGESGDRFLGPGESYRLPPSGMVLAEAVRGCALARLLPAASARRTTLALHCRSCWPRRMVRS
jgi:hypothetical protein